MTDLADELVSKEEIAAELLDYGLAPEVVAAAVGASVNSIRSLSPKSRAFAPSADSVLVDELRTLARLAVVEAQKMVMFGPTNQKLTIVRAMLSMTSNALRSDANEGLDTIRESLTLLFNEARSVSDTPEPVVTNDGVYDPHHAQTQALPAATTYQDEEP